MPTQLKSYESLAKLTVSQIAVHFGVHPQTIRRWTKTGLLKCSRTLGNHRRFEPPVNPASDTRQVVAYARVSTHDQKQDLVTQTKVLQQQNPDLVIKDLGSGLNYKKAGFHKLLTLILNNQVKELILTRKDRLLRFGSEIIFRICEHFQVKVTILYETELKEPMEQFCLDVIEIITVFSSTDKTVG